MATPQELYGWFPGNQQIPGGTDRWMTIPEQSGMLGFTGQRGPMSELAFQLAGSPSMMPGQGTILPYEDYPTADESAAGAGELGGLLGAAAQNPSVINQAKDLIGGLGGASSSGAVIDGVNLGTASGSQMFGGLGAAAGSSAAAPALFGSGAVDLGAISGSALFGGGAAGGIAGGGAPLAADAALANLGTATPSQIFGAAAPSGIGSGGAAAGSASGTGGGALAGSGLTTALPIAAVAWAAADLANSGLVAHGDEKRNAALWGQVYPGSGTQVVSLGRTGRQFGIMPDGTVVDPRYMENLMGAFYGATLAPDGNQAYWQQEYDRLLANPVTAQLPKGYIVKDGKIVRG